MNSRIIIVVSLATLVLIGCAEKNFIPGSPLAKLNGYTRTYEQIAADDCATRHVRGTDSHARCVTQIAASRRQQDAAHQQNAAAITATGAAIMATPPPAPQPSNSEDKVCIAPNNKLYRC